MFRANQYFTKLRMHQAYPIYNVEDSSALNPVPVSSLLYSNDSAVVLLNSNHFKKNLMYIESVFMCNATRLALQINVM